MFWGWQKSFRTSLLHYVVIQITVPIIFTIFINFTNNSRCQTHTVLLPSSIFPITTMKCVGLRERWLAESHPTDWIWTHSYCLWYAVDFKRIVPFTLFPCVLEHWTRSVRSVSKLTFINQVGYNMWHTENSFEIICIVILIEIKYF